MSEDALIRLKNLRALNYQPADLVRRVGSTYPYWRDLLAGKKSFGEKIARRIEASCNLVRGSLDDVDGAKPAPMAPQLPGKDGTPPYSEAAMTLAWLLDQITDQRSKVEANQAATAAILAFLRRPDAKPTRRRDPTDP